MKEIKTPPRISNEIVQYLDRLFPTLEITPDYSLPEIYFTAGQRRVIDYLKNLYEKQKEGIN